MRIDLVQIGNSQGIRLPKAVIEQAHLTTELELEVSEDTLIIRSVRRRREGWAEAAAQLDRLSNANRVGDDQLADWDASTSDFSGEWEWK